MGNSRQASKLSRYVISHPGQLSLAISPWVGAMSNSEGCGRKQAHRVMHWPRIRGLAV